MEVHFMGSLSHGTFSRDRHGVSIAALKFNIWSQSRFFGGFRPAGATVCTYQAAWKLAWFTLACQIWP